MKQCNIQPWSKRSFRQKKHLKKIAWCSSLSQSHFCFLCMHVEMLWYSLQNQENKSKNGVIQQLSLCSTNESTEIKI